MRGGVNWSRRMLEFIGELLISLVWEGLMHSLWNYADRAEKRNRAKRLRAFSGGPTHRDETAMNGARMRLVRARD